MTIKNDFALQLIPILFNVVVLHHNNNHIHLIEELVKIQNLVLDNLLAGEQMNKSPKYSVGCKVAYNGENGCECQGSVCRITEVGRGCFYYTLECDNGERCMLYEGRIIETDKLNE